MSTGDPSIGELIYLSPGSDPAGTSHASIRFRFGVTGVNGTFEIDTCCVAPANHLVFVDANVTNVNPTFTKGVETVGTPPPPNTPPVARCQPVVKNADGNCVAAVTAAEVNNGSSDTEDGTNLTLTLIPAGPYPRGVTPVWLRVTDTGGLKDSCTTTVTVNDVTNPIIACPGKDSVECQSAVPAAATNLAGFVAQGGTASDNCGAPTITFRGDLAAGSCPRTITRTYRATDGSGNFAECTQTIIVHDVTKPTITSCPKD
ncbi:MAG: hypothetical protein HY304_04315, partial [candidate division Zixibacteria bacterium]|nr:hypothetical protein [candidate division Zixibacteria bacterium]